MEVSFTQFREEELNSSVIVTILARSLPINGFEKDHVSKWIWRLPIFLVCSIRSQQYRVTLTSRRVESAVSRYDKIYESLKKKNINSSDFSDNVNLFRNGFNSLAIFLISVIHS